MQREREFLHSLSNQFAIVWAILETTIDAKKKSAHADPADLTRLEKAFTCLERIKVLLEDRREKVRAASTNDQAA